MEMCPYCGEEVPADSAKCWKCGTELDGSGKSAAAGGGASDELEVPDDEDEGGGGGGNEKIPCPHCEMPVLKKAQRCRECGRMLREPKANKAAAVWSLGTWVIVGGVGIAVAIGVVVASKRHHFNAQERTISKIEYADLEKRMQPLQPLQRERKQEVWTRDLEGKYVKWSGTITEVHIDTRHVIFSQVKGGTKGDVDVELREDVSSDDLTGLQVNQVIGYSARLVDFGKDGRAFTLNEGLIEK